MYSIKYSSLFIIIIQDKSIFCFKCTNFMSRLLCLSEKKDKNKYTYIIFFRIIILENVQIFAETEQNIYNRYTDIGINNSREKSWNRF